MAALRDTLTQPHRIALIALADLMGPLSAVPEIEGGRSVSALVVVTEDDVAALRRLPDLPGVGYLGPEDLTPAGLGTALSRMAAGEPPVPAWLVQSLLATLRAEPDRARSAPRLTPREQQALVLLVDGLSNKQIGRRLGISDHGAKRLVGNILAKLDCPNRTAVATFALRDGLYEQCLRNR
ncbi:LuxR C-terminal-related transcriptional regulator [Streptomyces sp. CSDS2]|uniref:LuxR C-terminal-related transcriptional regulator n=1 Tax=Streptomyces sp. CSDS2 TaxID=3055051 RepID=UPI0025B00BEA|nr:LuxR C-terminal-related transcriptional regulator [Streptomyces sp. CSDS2]MDN3260908.1 LuxR C-terminal-related transcriptional regulator [Streptomyces sp. CSDS2]